jgi:hypothetical protein
MTLIPAMLARILLLAVTLTFAAHAQTTEDEDTRDPLAVEFLADEQTTPVDDAQDPLTVELLTMGPGEHPFFKFGHNAIRVRNELRGTDVVYNFGTFSFESDTLLEDFFKGRLEYWLSRESMSGTLRHYGDEGRSLVAQRLALSPAQKRELKRQLDHNARRENRAYKYDYFFDNCSTRLRDAIDRVTDGQLRAALRAAATQTLRAHALRATADYFVEYLFLTIMLGPLVDRKTDRWAETYLPEMLSESVRHVSLRAPDGSTLPLVQSEETYLEHRDTRPTRPPRWCPHFYLAGTLVGLGLFGLARLSYRSRLASAALGVALALGGLVIGLLGLALAAFWALTDHAVVYRNQNLLLLSPLAIALLWYGIQIAIRGAKAIASVRLLSVLLVASVAAALLMKLLPVEQQDNATLIAFFLQCWTGLFAATAAPPIAGQQCR